jgi:hypothetical protein
MTVLRQRSWEDNQQLERPGTMLKMCDADYAQSDAHFLFTRPRRQSAVMMLYVVFNKVLSRA